MQYSTEQLLWLANHGFHSAILRELLPIPASSLSEDSSLALGLALRARGQFAAAKDRLLPLTTASGPQADNAFFAVLEIDLLTGRTDEMIARLNQSPERLGTDRGRLFQARMLAKTESAAGIQSLRDLASDSQISNHIRRLAAFDAANLLDKAGDFKAAFELAQKFHREMAGGANPQGLLEHLDQQIDALNQGFRPHWLHSQTPPTAFIVGVPRSGTTLLEQMLDNHTQIEGIGEFDGLSEIVHTMTSQGVSPYRFAELSESSQANLRSIYVQGARLFSTNSGEWTLDKNLLTWSSLPFLAELLPTAKFIHIQRDPRDVAVSIFLSWFDYNQHPWTSNFRDLYAVLYRAHALITRCLRQCRLEHHVVRYEDLVTKPKDEVEGCLRLLGLPFEEKTLSPESNSRTANTLSVNQVSQSLNQHSVGRWKNYEWMFDEDWHQLAFAAGY